LYINNLLYLYIFKFVFTLLQNSKLSEAPLQRILALENFACVLCYSLIMRHIWLLQTEDFLLLKKIEEIVFFHIWNEQKEADTC